MYIGIVATIAIIYIHLLYIWDLIALLKLLRLHEISVYMLVID